jgi:hypothetical protein
MNQTASACRSVIFGRNSIHVRTLIATIGTTEWTGKMKSVDSMSEVSVVMETNAGGSILSRIQSASIIWQGSARTDQNASLLMQNGQKKKTDVSVL